jgi:hypothetical protein
MLAACSIIISWWEGFCEENLPRCDTSTLEAFQRNAGCGRAPESKCDLKLNPALAPFELNGPGL